MSDSNNINNKFSEGVNNQPENAATQTQNTQNVVAQKTTQERIIDLQESLKCVGDAFENHEKKLYNRRNIWIGICLVFIVTIIVFYCILFSREFDENYFTWKVGFQTMIRITGMAMLISGLSFSIKMIKSYLNMIENCNHKRIIISSMGTLVESADKDRDVIYSKMIELVTKMTNTGIFKADMSEIKLDTLTGIVNKAVENLKK